MRNNKKFIAKRKSTKKSTRPLRNSQKGKKGVRLANRKSERNDSSETKVLQIDIDVNPSDFFSKNASFDQHYEAQVKNRDKYVATVMAFDEFSIEILPNAKSRSLAAAFCRNDKELIDYFLNHNKNFGFVDVLKALNILDAKRSKRALESKIERISKTGSVMKAQKMAVLKNNIHNLEKIQTKVGSCSGALARKIKKWVQKYSQEDLEYFALSFPTDPWKKLADIVHLNPAKDFPNAPWFLPYCFGEELPKGSKVERCKNINNQNVNEVVAEFELPYSYLKNYKSYLDEKSKEKCMELLQTVRLENIQAEIFHKNFKIQKALQSAFDENAMYAVIIGEQELSQNIVKLKDLTNKSEQIIAINEFSSIAKNLFKQ
jgi:hypothetical protein